MDNNILNENQKVYFETYVFKHHIERVWNVLKDAELIPSIYIDKSGCSDVKIIKGKNSFEVGSIFSLKIKDLHELIYEVDQVINQDEFKQITWRNINTTSSEMNYKYVYSLHATTNNNYALLIMEVFYEKDQFVLKEPKTSGELEKKEFFTLIDKYLCQNTKDLFQVESIIIKSTMNRIWGIITNWFEFKNLVPFIAEKVLYIGDPLIKGSKLVLKWPSKNVECHLKVISMKYDENEPIWEYLLECYDGIPKPPIQHLSFNLSKIKEDSIFLEFTHTFLSPIDYDILQNISQDKQKILLQLRKSLESLI